MISHFCPGISKPRSCSFTPSPRTAISRSSSRPVQSKAILSVRDHIGLCSAPPTPPCTPGGHRAQQPPDGRAASGSHEDSDRLSREQQLDFQGAWPLLCTHAEGYLVNPIKLRASRQIRLWRIGRDGLQASSSQGATSGPDAGSSCAFSELFKRTFPASVCHSISAFEALVF